MNIILGIISLIAVIVASVFITFVSGFELLHLSLLLIIPIGSIIIGYLCGYGYYKGLVISNKYITIKHFIIGFIISLFCIVAIKYTSYLFTYIDSENNTIIYSYKGDHISNYEAVGYGKLDFLTYNKYMIENTPISFVIKNIPLAEISNPVIGWLSVFIDFLGLVSGFILAGLIQKNKAYCHDCNLYKKNKKLFLISKEEKTDFFNKLNELMSEGNLDATYAMLSKYDFDKDLKKKEHLLCKLVYCKNCNDSVLNFELYELRYQKRIKKNLYYQHPISINYKIAEKFLNKEKPSIDIATKTYKTVKVNEELKAKEKNEAKESIEVKE
ncbi:MAG: hypothetical protein GX327_09245, partial [Epulopiscium sp.]|nr:hypothetical protein [Candidatus Epulonipiscium sp.]